MFKQRVIFLQYISGHNPPPKKQTTKKKPQIKTSKSRPKTLLKHFLKCELSGLGRMCKCPLKWPQPGINFFYFIVPYVHWQKWAKFCFFLLYISTKSLFKDTHPVSNGLIHNLCFVLGSSWSDSACMQRGLWCIECQLSFGSVSKMHVSFLVSKWRSIFFQGERLSHAVGCAFAACLERKQKREKECGVTATFDASRTTFTREGSFRVTTATEQAEREDVMRQIQDTKGEKCEFVWNICS